MESKAEKSLERKTKKELIEIILRKDDVEIRLKDTIKSKDEEIDTLNSRIVGYEADINGLERMRQESLNNVKELTQTLDKKYKTIRRWEIAFSVVLVVAIIIIAALA